MDYTKNKYELCQLLSNLKSQKSEIDIVILSKTLLMAIKRKYLIVKDYNMVSNEWQIAILIRKKLRYKIREDLSTFHESVFQNVKLKVEHSKKPTIVCSLYRSLNSPEAEFKHYYKQ